MSLTTPKSETDAAATQSAAAKLLHPEDISVGDEVTPAIESYDYPSFIWSMADPAIMPPDEKIRLSFLPSEMSKPFRVVAVCLPFVLCEKVDGKFRTFDVRQVQLMRLANNFAEVSRRSYTPKKRKKKLKSEQRKRQQTVAGNGAGADALELGKGVALEESFAVDATQSSSDLAQVVLFELTVQVPLADSQDVCGFFSVVVSQS